MARNVYGLDLGSYDIKVYDKKKDTIWKEKNVIAFKDNRDRDIFAVGDDAFSMYGKTVFLFLISSEEETACR